MKNGWKGKMSEPKKVLDSRFVATRGEEPNRKALSSATKLAALFGIASAGLAYWAITIPLPAEAEGPLSRIREILIDCGPFFATSMSSSFFSVP